MAYFALKVGAAPPPNQHLRDMNKVVTALSTKAFQATDPMTPTACFRVRQAMVMALLSMVYGSRVVRRQLLLCAHLYDQ